VKRLAAVILLALTAAAGTHKVSRDTAALEFNYEWPAEAAAIPKLDLILYKKAKAALAEAQKFAAEDVASARQDKRDFQQHYYDAGWQVAGASKTLLSLQYGDDTFEGGAHPNHNYAALLWDKLKAREIAVSSLFTDDAFGALTRRAYCAALDKERLERREGEKIGGEFDECPKYSELAIALSDKDHDGRFDAIAFGASPYVAGPYVEGPYDIELPVSQALIAALRPEYRASFEVQRQ